MKNKKYLWYGVIYGFLLTAFTAYILMDTFVITRAYTPMPSNNSSQNTNSDRNSISLPESSTDGTEAQTAVIAENAYTDDDNTGPDRNNTSSAESNADENVAPTALITDVTYKDDNISISLTEYKQYETNIHVADIQLSSSEYLKTAFAHGVYGQNVTEKTSETAQSNNAILAINGDYYGVRETGYVLRNGILYRSSSSGKEILTIYKDGSFSMFTEGEVSAEQLLSDGAEQILCFGPALVTHGEISVSDRSKVKNPRTAIGIIDDLHYVFVVTDGRVDDSEGLTYHELAEFMHSLNVKEAYNLDGGGSSMMYFNGSIINHLAGGENSRGRSVSDIVYIGY